MSSEALLRACLKRIDERDKDVCAWTTLDRDGAIAAAREVDGTCWPDSGNLPPLLGIPIGVKDNIATASLPTEYNSPIYRGHKPGSDAPVVELLRKAGAIVLGKTQTVEFAAHGGPRRHVIPANCHARRAGRRVGRPRRGCRFHGPVGHWHADRWLTDPARLRSRLYRF